MLAGDLVCLQRDRSRRTGHVQAECNSAVLRYRCEKHAARHGTGVELASHPTAAQVHEQAVQREVAKQQRLRAFQQRLGARVAARERDASLLLRQQAQDLHEHEAKRVARFAQQGRARDASRRGNNTTWPSGDRSTVLDAHAASLHHSVTAALDTLRGNAQRHRMPAGRDERPRPRVVVVQDGKAGRVDVDAVHVDVLPDIIIDEYCQAPLSMAGSVVLEDYQGQQSAAATPPVHADDILVVAESDVPHAARTASGAAASRVVASPVRKAIARQAGRKTFAEVRKAEMSLERARVRQAAEKKRARAARLAARAAAARHAGLQDVLERSRIAEDERVRGSAGPATTGDVLSTEVRRHAPGSDAPLPRKHSVAAAAEDAGVAAAAAAATTAAGAAASERDAERYVHALRRKLMEKVQHADVELPPLCMCGHTPFDDHPNLCANNCVFYHNTEAYISALSALLASLNVSI